MEKEIYHFSEEDILKMLNDSKWICCLWIYTNIVQESCEINPTRRIYENYWNSISKPTKKGSVTEANLNQIIKEIELLEHALVR